MSQTNRSIGEICTKEQATLCRKKHRRDSEPTNARVIRTDEDLMILGPARRLIRLTAKEGA